MELHLTGLIPTDKSEAFMGNSKVPVYEMADGTYQLVPDRNGTLKVMVTLINKQYTTQSITLESVDTQSPVLLGSEKIDDTLIIYFEETSGVLDYENIHAKNASGKIIKPISYDTKNLSVTFKYPSEALNIFVSDMSGNTLQLVVTLK